VLLLLDYWPLRRQIGWQRLVVEKLPLLGLAAADSVVTYLAQSSTDAVANLQSYPLAVRISNGLISYVVYLRKTVWPVDLAVFYPHPEITALSTAAMAAVILAGVSCAALIQRRRRPYILVGWLWYLGVLVPVLGIIRVGDQAMADRFTYLPHVGLFVAMVWAAADAGRHWRIPPAAQAAAAMLVVALFAISTSRQLAHWRDSESLFRHALAVTSENALAHTNLGALLLERGSIAAAREHVLLAVQLKPASAKAQLNRGMLAAADGQRDEAINYYREAIRLQPRYPTPHYNLGILLAERGDYEAAVQQYTEAVRLRPDYTKAYNNLGRALSSQGRLNEAIIAYETALQLDPDMAVAQNNLAVALEDAGRPQEAVAHYAESARLSPDDARPLFNLGLTLRGLGRVAEAQTRLRDCIRVAESAGQKDVAAAARQQLGE
jgi:protein O-mannosyl-transferase